MLIPIMVIRGIIIRIRRVMIPITINRNIVFLDTRRRVLNKHKQS